MYKDKLKEIRLDLNIKQKNIADHLNISVSSYATYENEIDIFPIKHLITVVNYLNISVDYLFSLTDNKNYSTTSSEVNKTKSSKRLKEFRKENKLTQENLAQKLNISRTTIAEYERGTNIIATPFLYSICKTYKISSDYLLGRTDEPKYLP